MRRWNGDAPVSWDISVAIERQCVCLCVFVKALLNEGVNLYTKTDSVISPRSVITVS